MDPAEIAPHHGNVLVLTTDASWGERLRRWVEAAGERAVLLCGAEKFLMVEGDDTSIDLLVTDLDTDDPASAALIDRLVRGDLFEGVPQIHLFRDLGLQAALTQAGSSFGAASMASPPEAGEFQARVRLAAEVGRLRRELQRQSIRDPMTGLFNRRYLLLRLEEEFSRARRHRTALSLALFDVDHLKQINDAFGQVAGDSVIRGVARTIRGCVRKEDVLGRIGEEAFAIVLPGNRYRGAATFANKVRTDTEGFLSRYDHDNAQVRISAGISTFPDNGAVRSPDDLIRMAENALSQAKARGGNRVFIDEGVLRQARPVVLVADADEALLDLAEDLLGLDDLQVLRAPSARAALETLRFRRPDLLVLDVHLAEEESGATLIERVAGLAEDGRFPVVGLSSDPRRDAEELQRLGVDRYITKPFSLTVLRSLVRELLDVRGDPARPAS
jgi:diguanylate cyclase (GGDEF)-like protein